MDCGRLLTPLEISTFKSSKPTEVSCTCSVIYLEKPTQSCWELNEQCLILTVDCLNTIAGA